MLSIIVTAYKEPHLNKCLDSIFSQNLPENCEILVVAPDEKTISIVKEYQRKNKNIKTIKDPGVGKPTALNLAFKVAKGDILVLTDGDVILDRNSIKALLKHFKNKKVGAVSGKVVYKIPKNNFFFEWAKISERIFDEWRKSQDKQNKLWHPTGYLYAIRKGIVKKINPNALSDDAFIGYLIKKKGYLIKYEPKAKVYVKFPRSIKDFINQKARTRAGFLQLKKWFKFKGRTVFSELKFLKYCRKFYGTKKLFKLIAILLLYLIAWVKAYWILIRRKKLKEVWKRIKTTK